MALALQRRVARIGGELGFRCSKALLGLAALNDVDPAKNDDRGVDALGFKDLLRFGDLQQHSHTAHFGTGEQVPIGVGQLIAGGLQDLLEVLLHQALIFTAPAAWDCLKVRGLAVNAFDLIPGSVIETSLAGELMGHLFLLARAHHSGTVRVCTPLSRFFTQCLVHRESLELPLEVVNEGAMLQRAAADTLH